MLKQITIKDFAIIDQSELELDSGMTVLTGETGAGKSILLDALGLALGDRANSNTVREGAKKADITARFEIDALPHIIDWLSNNDFDDDDECMIRRVVNADGKSRSYINGHPAPLQTVRLLAAQLIDIHGQHEHQSLTKASTQQNLLDHYAANDKLLSQLKESFQQWKTVNQLFEKLQGSLENREQRLDTLRFQVNEMETINLSAEALESLGQEHKRLANAEKIIELGQQSVSLLYETDRSVHNLLAQAQQHIIEMGQLDSTLLPVQELITNALVYNQETVDSLTDYLSQTGTDPGLLVQAEQLLTTLHDLARKHRIEPENLADKLLDLQTELAELDDIDQQLSNVSAEKNVLAEQLTELSKKLSQKRNKAAAALSKAITKTMQTLNMAGGQFQIDVTYDSSKPFAQSGQDTIDFLVSANPGQPPMPLSKVASGGELSRISLAIQMIVHKYSNVPRMIFDEVDSGIGGATAEIVGKLLRSLGNECQILCVTHLPQVAAKAHQHIQVCKTVSNNVTQTSLIPLSNNEKIEEIARMLGGITITEQSRSHAAEMLAEV